MIDFFIKIGDNISNSNFSKKPYDGLLQYKKYINVEKENYFDNIYYFSNCFYDDEHLYSHFESDSIHFFVLGKVYYRNSHPNTSSNNLNINEVYNIFEKENDFCKIIKGNYTIITINKSSLEVHLINSPYGVYPVNYSVQNGIIYISSSLTMIKAHLENVTVNKAALVQVSLFDTILGNNTLIREIEQLQYGEDITINKCGNIHHSKYYDHSTLFYDQPLDRKDAINELISTLKINSETWPMSDKFLLGLTGGYDCRLNFSLIKNQNYKNITSYTYGMAISPEIKIAKIIAAKYNIKHEIIYLEEEFEKEYVQNADEVLRLSDGFTPFMRVNYYCSHKHLSQFGHECITGMYGSEFIKPMHVMEDSVTINPATVNAFFSEDIIGSLVEYFNKTKESSDAYFSKEVFTQEVLEETIELIKNNYITGKEKLSKEQRIFNFYINEGMRKFFMELIRVDKMFVNHVIPYLDIDFIELLLKTQYAGVYNHIFDNSLFKRRKGQLFYVDALNKINPELNNIVVDRGYKPKYLASKAGWLLVSVGYVLGKKLRKLIKGNTTFNTKKWRSMVYEANIELLSKNSNLFNSSLTERYKKGYHLQNEHTFGKHFSIKKWLNDNNLLE